MTTIVTPTWAAKEVALSFAKALRGKRPVYRPTLETGVLDIHADLIPTDGIDVMAARCARVGRMLADEAWRKRLRYFCDLESPNTEGVRSVLVHSADMGVALRLVEQLHPTLRQTVYRFDMRGSRYATPQVVALDGYPQEIR